MCVIGFEGDFDSFLSPEEVDGCETARQSLIQEIISVKITGQSLNVSKIMNAMHSLSSFSLLFNEPPNCWDKLIRSNDNHQVHYALKSKRKCLTKASRSLFQGHCWAIH